MRISGDRRIAYVLIFALACADGPDTRITDSSRAGGRADSPVEQPAEVPGHFAIADFKKLRWLGGSWRGSMPNGGSFHERYRVVDDSTITMQSFSDSTFRQATDSSSLTLRDSVITNVGGGGSARWVATRLDSTGVHFVPDRGAGNNFTFRRDSTDFWTATLNWPNGRHVIYRMRRVGK